MDTTRASRTALIAGAPVAKPRMSSAWSARAACDSSCATSRSRCGRSYWHYDTRRTMRSARRPLRRSLPGTTERGLARAEGEMNDTDARLWHPWLRINRVLA
jgi:hypothetical protein